MKHDLARAGLQSSETHWTFMNNVRYITESAEITDDTLLRMLDTAYITKPVLQFQGKAKVLHVPDSRQQFLQVGGKDFNLIRSQSPCGFNRTPRLIEDAAYRVQVFECDKPFLDEERPFCRVYAEAMIVFYCKARPLQGNNKGSGDEVCTGKNHFPAMGLSEHVDLSWDVSDFRQPGENVLQAGKCYRVLIEDVKKVAGLKTNG